MEEKQSGARTCIGALKSSLEDSNGMILGCNIVQTLGTAAIVSASRPKLWCSCASLLFLNPWLQSSILLRRGGFQIAVRSSSILPSLDIKKSCHGLVA